MVGDVGAEVAGGEQQSECRVDGLSVAAGQPVVQDDLDESPRERHPS